MTKREFLRCTSAVSKLAYEFDKSNITITVSLDSYTFSKDGLTINIKLYKWLKKEIIDTKWFSINKTDKYSVEKLNEIIKGIKEWK